MKKLLSLLFFTSGIMILFMISDVQAQSGNPLLSDFKTPFQVPPFDKIKSADYMPAFQVAMEKENEEVRKIAENKSAPTFQNTIEALDHSGLLLNRISAVFFSMTSANTNDELQKIRAEITPVLSKHGDDIMMNPALFKRIQAVYEKRDNLSLTTEQKRLLEKQYKSFVKNGAALDAEKQKRLREINEEMSSLSVKFGDNLLKETKAYKLVIEKNENLSGLPQSIIDAAADDAAKANLAGKWVFTLDNASIMPFLTYADNRALREQILKAYENRGNNNNEYDNKAVMARLINLRVEKANLLGYKNFASLMLEDRMAKTPEKAYDLMNKLWEPAQKVAAREAAELQAYIDKKGGKFKLQPWDWRYYAEKVRKEKYDLDEEQIRPYFALENVRQGAFMTAHKLYGINFTELKNVPKYHPDNYVYEVKDKNGSHLGILYMDFHPRASKRGGAWCGSFRDQFKLDGKDIRPVVSVVCNFSRPTADAPALLSFDEATTLFHEFGHSLQALMSKVTYRGVGDLVRDYVELPSQVMENWAADPEVINMYARHYKTGKPMPKELLDKITASRQYGEGFAVTEYLAAALLDMDYHTIDKPVESLDITTFENNSLKKMALIPEILPRYRTTYFNHISNDGYAAGYYVYIWAQVLDADAFEAFKETGLFDQKLAKRFRENVLEKGSSEDEMDAYKRFRGAEPSITPLLKRRGLM